MKTAFYHLPGLFEFYELHRRFLPLFYGHREYFYDDCAIASVYGAPAGCLWGGGRTGFGDADARSVRDLLRKYGISARLTFSNSLLREEHLADAECNALCRLFSEHEEVEKSRSCAENEKIEETGETGETGEDRSPPNGVIVHSDLLASYLRQQYPELYLVSSTTKVLTAFPALERELGRPEFRYVVPDFRLNKAFDCLAALPQEQKDKVEFLCNECCPVTCGDRKRCYEAVSRKNLGEDGPEHVCRASGGGEGYRFSRAMESPAFIGIEDIRNRYLPMGFSNFKIEGRGLGSALVLEFLLYYLTKPEYQLRVREEVYLDNMLDLF